MLLKSHKQLPNFAKNCHTKIETHTNTQTHKHTHNITLHFLSVESYARNAGFRKTWDI